MSSKTDNFITKHKEDVIKSTSGTGLFPSVKMAQMIVESSWGTSANAIKANNFFGIKADSRWTGDKIALNTPKDNQPISYFRAYPTVRDSITDHSNFLKNNQRYPKAGVFSSTTPEQQLRAIADAGYSEGGKGFTKQQASDHYYNLIMGIINKYNLKELDGMQGYKAIAGVKAHPILTISITAVLLISTYALIKLLTQKNK